MAEFNVADGSVATILKQGSPLALMKGYQPNTWFYAPRAAVITRTPDTAQRPLYMVVRNRRRLSGGQGFETIGGVFACQLELAVPIPSLEEQNEWTEHIRIVSSIRPVGSNSFRFQPMRLRSGRLSIQGADQYVLDPARLRDIPIGASSTIPITLELNKLGADTFAAALSAPQGNGLPVTGFMQFQYDLVVPECHYKITANNRKVYDYFSVNVKARASYWGLVGAQTDIQRTREELVSSGGIVIEQVSAPAGFNNERIKQLENAIVDSWIKNVLNKIAEKPQMNPAEAPDPKGFFGGVSVSLKSYTEIQNLNLSAEVKYSTILPETYSLSYVFGPLLGQGNPRDHLLDVNEDNKLPIVINLCKDERIHRYTGQFGYRKTDGTFVANALTDVRGAVGEVLTGAIQFAVGEPMPDKTEVQLSVDWNEADWEDRLEKHTVQNNDSGASFLFSPGNNIAKIKLVTDLEMADAGTISIINYKTQMPPFNGQPVKVYSGSLVLVGQGPTGTVKVEEIQFPYFAGTQNQSKLLWDVSITKPDGATVTKNGEESVTKSAIPMLKGPLLQGAPTGPGAEPFDLIQAFRRVGPVKPRRQSYKPAHVPGSEPPADGAGYDSSMVFG
jgi:hypothetical protein